MKVVIMAGGKGTRIAQVTSEIPKPMIEIDKKPILEHQINCLVQQGFRDIIITVGYQQEVIINYFGDGSSLGANIKYFREEKPLGNAGALFELKGELQEDFLLLNADAVFNIDLRRFVRFHKSHKGLVSIFTHPNSHPYDSGIIVADDRHCVLQWLAKEDKRPEWYKNRVNAGIHIISHKILKKKPDSDKVDLDRQLLKPMAGTGQMFCYDSPEYVKDMGTPERYEAVSRDYANGVVQLKSLKEKQKAFFLDRDGTINKYVGFLRNVEEMELIPGVAEAIKRINSSGYLAIVVTNQPVIARGEVSFEGLENIHNKMETLLGKEGAYIDAIYYCPHHPHSGYDGEIAELKKECECRKPKPGLLLKAATDFNIELSKSWMIGDSESDVLAGLSAGCQCVQIDERYNLLNAVKDILGVDEDETISRERVRGTDI